MRLPRKAVCSVEGQALRNIVSVITRSGGRFSAATLSQKVALNTTAQLAGRVFSGVAGVVSVAVTTRYLPIQQVGVLLAGFTFVGFFLVGSTFGLSAAGARMIARHPEDCGRIVSSVGLANTILSFVLAGAGYVAAQFAYSGPGNVRLREAIVIFLSQLVVMGPKVASQAYFIFRQQAALTTLINVIARSISLVLLLAAVAFDGGLLWIAAAMASTAILDGALSSAVAIRVVGIVRPSIRLGWSLVAASASLGLILMVNILYFRLDLILLSLLSSKREVALYGIPYKLVDFLIMLPSAFMLTLFPVMAQLEPSSDRLHRVVQKAFTMMQIAAIPVVVLGIYAGDIVQLLGGSAYHSAAPLLRLLLVSLGFSFLQGVFGNALVALNRQRPLLVLSGLVLALNLALNLLLIPKLQAQGAAIAVVASELFALGGARYIYARESKPPSLYRPVRTAAAGVVMALVMALRFVPGLSGEGPVLALLMGGTAGLAAYVMVLYKLGALPEFVFDFTLNRLRRFRPAVPTRG